MSEIETMRVKPWGKGQGEYVTINKSDFDPKVHEAYDAPASKGKSSDDKDDGDALQVGKGPGGKFYVKKGREPIAGPFDTQDEAKAKQAELEAEAAAAKA